jgi:dTMP kinase
MMDGSASNIGLEYSLGMPQGHFISLDGIDGGGKSTQCRLLAEWLREQGCDVVTCRDPGGTPVGDRVREILLDARHEMTVACEAFLYMASRSELVKNIIRPALTANRHVLADRFLLASVVYQGHAGGVDPAEMWRMGQVATDGVLPELTLVLDLPPEVAFARKTGVYDRMEAKGLSFFQKVREGFRAEAARNPVAIKLIDANRSVELVQQDIRQEVSRVVGQCARA